MPLAIAVCVKRVPDTAADKILDPDDFTLDRDSVEAILGPVDEVAVEEALRLKEAHGGEVTVVTAGPEGALVKAARKALSMGCDRAIHLTDPALHGSDALAVAYALSMVLAGRPFDLILCGSESTDARTSLVPPALAEFLGLPGLMAAKVVTVDGAAVRIHRERDNGYDVIEAAMPAVIGVNWGANEPRYPSFKGIQTAKGKPVEVLGVAEAGIDAARVGLEGSQSRVLGVAARASARRTIVVDNKAGDAHIKLADFLQEEHFI
ncbi:MAG TPA: electron transfer flavoprotein subunit beta/FixA family protein [Actinomycetota bacterium]|nr:electron transfer flavoprotein subunit beta/FixA family protein [Actinomycetota bacterium]